MKSEKEKAGLLSRYGSCDREVCKKLKIVVLELKSTSRGSEEQNKVTSWKPNLHISQKRHDLVPIFGVSLQPFTFALYSSVTAFSPCFSANLPSCCDFWLGHILPCSSLGWVGNPAQLIYATSWRLGPLICISDW